jgi:hypothetical protein
MPDMFIIFLLRFVVLWLNAFPNANGASTEHSPREIVTGLKMDYPKHCRARFGAYVEASQDSDITNTLNDRTAPCIVLGPTGNVQGSVNCYNLETKEVVTRRTIFPLPMPDRVVRRVIKLGDRCKQKRVSARIQFLNRHKEQFSWGDGTEDDDNAQGLMEQEPHETDALPDEIPGVDLESDHVTGAIEPDVLTEAATAAAALQNANLCNTNTNAEIAGVVEQDLTPPAVTDDDGDGDEADNEEDDDSELGYNGPPDGDLQGELRMKRRRIRRQRTPRRSKHSSTQRTHHPTAKTTIPPGR